MEIAIIGLPQSGKTTVFNALTRGKAETAPYSSADVQPNIGVVKVPDHRLDELARMFKPKRIVPADVTYIDIGGRAVGFAKSQGFSSQFLNIVGKVDAFIHVVRAFENESVPHMEGSINSQRDIDTVDLELIFADLSLIEKRLQRIETSLKGAKQQERELAQKEQGLLNRIKQNLENDIPVSKQELTEEERKSISSYQFLTTKPILILLNIGEDQLDQAETMESEFRSRYHGTNFDVAALCGKLEMELSQLENGEAEEFRSALGIKESGLDRIVRLSHSLLGLISFFTTASGEVKAWTIRRDIPASKAAGKIHSDMERGFIRAEVVAYQDLMRCSSLAEARKEGLLRLEGKTHPVQDGDVITFLFNV